MNTKDTIIAPATAPGDGGIAIVRISGIESLPALLHFFRSSSGKKQLKTHHLYHGLLNDSFGQPIDEVMAVYMAAPHTYTRDDVVEIHCHGSRQVIKSILNLYQSYGLRLAEPGEFTYRAFINGRLDLSQAEAVSHLIHSKTDSSRKLALAQVGGALSCEIYSFTAGLKNVLVLTEAWIDFPEEDLPVEDIQFLNRSVQEIRSKINVITDSYACGRVLSEGVSILLVGQPNVGKSSLLNALLGEDRAIVTDVPGTTRDLIEEGLVIDNVPVRLIDTAGLRESANIVEIEGIRRAEKKLSQVDLVLLLVDSSKKLDEQDFYVYKQCVDLPVFLILTKVDLDSEILDLSFSDFPAYRVSTKIGTGLDKLRREIADFFVGDYSLSSESVMLTERRHYEALLFCLKNLDNFLDLMTDNASLDLMAFELREALHYLGQISGETTTESLLDDIFSDFCIGK